MAFTYTNKHNIPLALAVFLMYDDYGYDERSNAISATSLMKPMRQIVLSQQNKQLLKTVDISDLVASRMGSSIHDGCEKAWTDMDNIAKALKLAGASDIAIESIRINPDKPVKEDEIAIYVEQRTEKEIIGYVVTGKFDLVMHGVVNDYKTGSVWGYIYDSNAQNHIKQGSIYKWLNQDKITSEYININYIFTDWSAANARQDPKGYPQLRCITKKYPLWGPEETEHWIMNRLEAYQELADATQDLLPKCTDEELWASKTVHKYYKNPNSMSRSTKNFDDIQDAITRKANDGDVGVIKTVPGEVKACQYCAVVGVCDQAEEMLASGRLVL
jgi:hypothetical protein